jgi:hypothetical protein
MDFSFLTTMATCTSIRLFPNANEKLVYFPIIQALDFSDCFV